jgi:small-conductance mechanosensitive channel
MNKYLLSNKFKIIGIILLLFSILLFILNFIFGFELELLRNVTVFSISPMNLNDGKSVTTFVANQNINTSLIGILFVSSLLLIAITKEKKENIAVLKNREYSLIITLIFNAILLSISFLFVWGFTYVYALFINGFSTLILYNCIFYYRNKYYTSI